MSIEVSSVQITFRDDNRLRPRDAARRHRLAINCWDLDVGFDVRDRALRFWSTGHADTSWTAREEPLNCAALG
jgi:hypothetical protein